MSVSTQRANRPSPLSRVHLISRLILVVGVGVINWAAQAEGAGNLWSKTLVVIRRCRSRLNIQADLPTWLLVGKQDETKNLGCPINILCTTWKSQVLYIMKIAGTQEGSSNPFSLTVSGIYPSFAEAKRRFSSNQNHSDYSTDILPFFLLFFLFSISCQHLTRGNNLHRERGRANPRIKWSLTCPQRVLDL